MTQGGKLRQNAHTEYIVPVICWKKIGSRWSARRRPTEWPGPQKSTTQKKKVANVHEFSKCTASRAFSYHSTYNSHARTPLDFRTHWTVNSEFWIRNSELLGNCTSKSIWIATQWKSGITQVYDQTSLYYVIVWRNEKYAPVLYRYCIRAML